MSKNEKSKPLKKKGTMEWKKDGTVLTCNGVPIAEIRTVEDDLGLEPIFYHVRYADKAVAPGKYKGWKDIEKAKAHIVKRFGL